MKPSLFRLCRPARLSAYIRRRKGRLLEQAEQFEDDYDNDNYSDYVENASVRAGD
jgi:hypothetical protein